MRRPGTLWFLLLSVVAGSLVVNCTAPKTEGELSDGPDSAESSALQASVLDTMAVDTVLTFDEIVLEPDLQPWSDSLRKYFEPSQVAMLNRATAEFKAIKSSAELAKFYQVTLRDSVQPMIEKQFQAGCKHTDYGAFADDDWDWISEFMPSVGTRASCKELATGMECVHHAPVSMIPLLEAAKKTPEPSDDRFFNAVIAIYTGSEPGAPIELMEVFDESEDYEPKQNLGCDWCTVSMLGDGYRGTIVIKLASAAKSRGVFSKAFTADLNYLFQDLKEEHYYNDKAAILSELDLIISKGKESKLLTARELASLEQTRTWIQEKEGGFDCANVTCDFGTSASKP